MDPLFAFKAAIWKGVSFDAGQTVSASPSSIQTDTPALRNSDSRALHSEYVTGGGLRFGVCFADLVGWRFG